MEKLSTLLRRRLMHSVLHKLQCLIIILDRCVQSAVTTMWGTPLAGSRISLPILFGHQQLYIIFLLSFSSYIIPHILWFVKSLLLRSFGGRERNRTPPNWWIPLSILSNDIQTHGASTISDPVMPVRNEWFAIPFSFSTYIISNLAANVKSLLIFFCHRGERVVMNILAPPSLLVLSAYVGL